MKAFGLTNRKIYKHLGGGLYCGKKNNFTKTTENGKKSTNSHKTTENVKLVSQELIHFGVIARLFRQIGGHSSRFVYKND